MNDALIGCLIVVIVAAVLAGAAAEWAARATCADYRDESADDNRR